MLNELSASKSNGAPQRAAISFELMIEMKLTITIN